MRYCALGHSSFDIPNDYSSVIIRHHPLFIGIFIIRYSLLFVGIFIIRHSAWLFIRYCSLLVIRHYSPLFVSVH